MILAPRRRRSPRHVQLARLTGASLLASLLVRGTAVAQPPAPRPGTATLTGVVLSDPAETPVAVATVTLVSAGRAVRTDSLGRFTFRDVPMGAQTLRVRAIGYDPLDTEFELADGETVDLELLVLPIVTELSAVTVTESIARRSTFYREFNERRRAGQGRFIDSTDFRQELERPLSLILRSRLPGLNIVRFAGREVAASKRGFDTFTLLPRGDARDASQGAPPSCYVNVLLNNQLVYNSKPGEPLFDLDQLHPNMIEAIEYYTAATLPPQFNRGANGACGVLVIWLRP